MAEDRWLEEERELCYRRQLQKKRRLRRQRRRISAISFGCLLVFSFSVIVLIAGGHHKKVQERSLVEELLQEGEDQLPPLPRQEHMGGDEAVIRGDTSSTIGSVGDVMLHLPIIEAYGGLEPGNHDFTSILETFRSAYESVDYMVVNLEASLGGVEKEYSGFPNFNVPDEIVTNLQQMGVDLQLLANNHMYDNGRSGFFRTISVCRQAGVNYTGVRGNEADPMYLIQDINGIRVGIMNYTYETGTDSKRKSLNDNPVEEDVEMLINSYREDDMESFYSEIEQLCREMDVQGAEFVILYIHWGNEYELEPNATQKAIAERLCEIGIDAVIGSHPHVVQPAEVLVSSDGTHKMFCAYSLGNHLSNQRRERISSRPNGHTEDGMMLKLTISRTAGEVSITGIEAIATYVYKTTMPEYYVIPVYQVEGIEEQTGLAGIRTSIQASYDRTWNIIGSSIEDARWELGITGE